MFSRPWKSLKPFAMVASQLNGTRTRQLPTVVIMSHSVMSDAQFAAAVNAGGASRRLDTGEAGPAHGYYVGRPGHEHVLSQPATAASVAAHRQAILDSGITTGYQGGWHSPTSNSGVLDHSVRVNTRALAHSMGTAWNQEAVYDAARGVDLPMTAPAPTRESARVKS